MAPETFGIENKEGGEKGRNVEILVKFIRHGERDKSGNLPDYGREVTAQKAQNSGLATEGFDAVKAIGSNAGPKTAIGGRALETADIYAHEIAGDETFNTRVRDILSYETIKSPVPYDHVAIYNAALPADYESLSDENKAAAAKKAQTAVVNHLLSLDTPEADTFRKETAGAFASVLEHYQKVAQRLNPESKVLIPAGTHGGTMELLLQQALVRKNEAGEEITGFKTSQEIGGEFSPSESYNVDIKTDADGNFGPLAVTFDNPERQLPEGMYLDPVKVKELAEYYMELHQEK